MNPRALLTSLVLAAAPLAGPAAAQPSTQARTILVDEGGSYEIAVHPDFVTVLYLPDAIQKAIASDNASYEVKALGTTSLAIRPLTATARPANLALVTDSVKVSVILHIAARRDEAMTQVTFKRADVEAELARRIDAAVAERTAALEARIAALQAAMDAELPRVAEGLIAARVLDRRGLRALDAIERNDDHVVVEATEVLVLGDDAYLVFAIENRSGASYHLASVALRDGAIDRAGLVRFAGDAREVAGRGVIGVVRAGGTGRGVVVVRRAGELTGRPLALVVAGPGGRGAVVVDRVVLR